MKVLQDSLATAAARSLEELASQYDRPRSRGYRRAACARAHHSEACQLARGAGQTTWPRGIRRQPIARAGARTPRGLHPGEAHRSGARRPSAAERSPAPVTWRPTRRHEGDYDCHGADCPTSHESAVWHDAARCWMVPRARMAARAGRERPRSSDDSPAYSNVNEFGDGVCGGLLAGGAGDGCAANRQNSNKCE